VNVKSALIPPLVVGPFAVNCWLVAGTQRQALVIDPGGDADQILGELKRLDLTPALYLLTHGHADHLGALEALLAVHAAEVWIHAADAAWAFTPANALPPYYPPLSGVPARLRSLKAPFSPQSTAGLSFEIIPTPGHSPGGVCYYFPEQGRLFTGDTLFAGTVGRTDLPGGNEAVLAQSLKQLARLPGTTLIHPGHGESSTLAEELRSNPFLQA
jgi:glyoxylase-like metal-dependent hydrolase (beta-lactamase superfamily II)